MVAVALRSTAVRTPSDGSNLASVTLDIQLVVVDGTLSHTICVAVCAIPTVGRSIARIAATPSAQRILVTILVPPPPPPALTRGQSVTVPDLGALGTNTNAPMSREFPIV
jgi:hypothetical protein